MKKRFFCSITFALFIFNLNAQNMPRPVNDPAHINYITSTTAQKVIGSGEAVTKPINLDKPFDEIVVGNGISVAISPAYKNLQITAENNLLPLVDVQILEGQLVVKLSASLETFKGIKIQVPAANISKITAKEGANIEFVNDEHTKSASILLQSGAAAACNIQLENFSTTVMGGASLSIQGNAQHSKIVVKGGSVMEGNNLKNGDVDITLLGSSLCSLNVNSHLDARVENESILNYSGNPVLGKQQTALNGKIIGQSN
jgi:hypothetical protein